MLRSSLCSRSCRLYLGFSVGKSTGKISNIIKSYIATIYMIPRSNTTRTKMEYSQRKWHISDRFISVSRKPYNYITRNVRQHKFQSQCNDRTMNYQWYTYGCTIYAKAPNNISAVYLCGEITSTILILLTYTHKQASNFSSFTNL